MHTHACTLAQLILSLSLSQRREAREKEREMNLLVVVVADRERALMILPQVHLRKPCYDFSFL